MRILGLLEAFLDELSQLGLQCVHLGLGLFSGFPQLDNDGHVPRNLYDELRACAGDVGGAIHPRLMACGGGGSHSQHAELGFVQLDKLDESMSQGHKVV